MTLLGVTMLVTGACGSDQQQNDPAAEFGSFSISAEEHIVRDDSGSYFCVLRRPDDLAQLRAQFNSSNEGT